MNENDGNQLPRSHELMSRTDTALVVVDVQEKLIGAMPEGPQLVWNIRRLLDAASALNMPAFASEQYPQGLGPTVPELACRLGSPVPSKLSFSVGGCAEFCTTLAQWRDQGIVKIVVAGIEAHVCIAQTVFDLLADGWRVYVPVDAVSSRFKIDLETALRRIDSAGATLTTVEAAMFEWCETAAANEFKAISRLAREPYPTST